MDDLTPFDIPVNKKSSAASNWLPDIGLVQITQMRGNFWKSTGMPWFDV